MTKHRYEVGGRIMALPDEPKCVCEVIAKSFEEALEIVHQYTCNIAVDKIEKMEQVHADSEIGILTCVPLKLHLKGWKRCVKPKS